MEIPTPWLISLISSLILRKFWRNLKQKMRGGRSFFKVGKRGGEEESVLMGFEMK